MSNAIRNILIVALIISLATNVFMYQRFRNRRVYMSICGRNITQQDIYDYLVEDKGESVKVTLTERYMIDDAAQKKGLVPTEEEITQRLNEEKEQRWEFARQMSINPWLETEYRARFKQDIEFARLITADITVTEDQIKDEYNHNQPLYDTPSKAYCYLGLLRNTANQENIRQLLEKDLSPVTIQSNYYSDIVFLGDNKLDEKVNCFIFFQPFNTTQNKLIFDMQPSKVLDLDPGQFQNQGIKRLFVKMIKIIPGKKADLADKKTHDTIRMALALRRAPNKQKFMIALWDAAKETFSSEDKNDKRYIERMLAPERQNQ